uniref:Nodulin-related protein 1 n=1 Tax=Kalanchoe fedtschenkoi TaxID=63787 RepID=A0A7N0TRH4_KALFE
MDFLKDALNAQSGHKPAAPSNQDHHQTQTTHKQPSTTELLSSAKVVAGAAKATLAHKTEEVDKGRVAGAAGDLLGAAKHYGKLEEKGGLGKYVGQAETYLHKYESTHSSGGPAAAQEKKDEHGGAGDYLKMAQGFLKK